MEVVKGIGDVRAIVRQAKRDGKTVGLVPTMGYLHDGHLSLVRRARQECGLVVVSVFVNPLQFGPHEDFSSYPRDLDQDRRLLEQAQADVMFAPPVAEMYPQGQENTLTFVEVCKITARLCGASRPGHFRGVATVVSKLFHIVEPDKAYFGQKDAQQVAVIQRMAEDLNMAVRIVPVPTVREADGLAMSSRNTYLRGPERQAALVLSQALQLARRMLAAGERDAAKIRGAMQQLIAREPLADVEYISISDPVYLTEMDPVRAPALVALAVKIGRTRLIDNIVWEE